MTNKKNVKLMKSALRLTIMRSGLMFLWILIISIVIGLTLHTLQIDRFTGSTEILVRGDNKKDNTEVLSYIIKSEDFYNVVQTKGKNENIALDVNADTFNKWTKNVSSKILAEKQVISIEIIGRNKSDTLSEITLIQNVLTEKYTDYIDNSENTDLKIITSARVSDAIVDINLPYYILYSSSVGLALVVILFGYKYYTLYSKRKSQRLRYIKYIKQKKRGKTRNHFKKHRPKNRNRSRTKDNGTTTEEEVKDRLNKLIRGEDILSQMQDKKASKNNHSS